MTYSASPIFNTKASGRNSAATPATGVNSTGSDIIFIGLAAYFVPTPTITDNTYGNTFTSLTKYTDAGSSDAASLYYCENPTVGADHQVTAAVSLITATVNFFGFSGAKLSGAFDTGKDTGSSASSTTIQPGAFTPSENGCLVVGMLSFNQTSGTISIDSPFSIIDQTNAGVSDHYGGASFYAVQGTAASANPTLTAGSSQGMAVAMAAFKAATVSAVGHSTLLMMGI